MRFRIIVCSLAFIVVSYLLAIRVRSFVHLFFEHAGITLTQDDIALAHNETTPEERTQYIPKIIHQVFHDWNNIGMQDDWNKLRQTCISQNKGWQYVLWSETTSRALIETEYPWFLKIYDGYRYPVQRVDAIRYFIMRHYGGIYLDLDNGCLQPLDPLIFYPSWTTTGGRGALSNNILGSVPDHAFWRLLTSSLPAYNYNYLFPYITISFASGQWFETAIWETYHAMLPPQELQREESRVYQVLMDDRPGSPPSIFFSQERGGTWVNWDNRLFLFIGDHLILTAVTACLFGFLFVYVCLKRGKKQYRRALRVGRFGITPAHLHV